MMKTDNELIAEFMGYRVHDGWVDLKVGQMESGNLKYDIDWSWLMSVVDKIESVRHIGIDAVYFKIEGKTCQIWTYFDVKEFLRLTGDDKNEGNKFRVGHTAKTKIDATYHACLDFIKWYNNKAVELPAE